jgi:hypothetical protein
MTMPLSPRKSVQVPGNLRENILCFLEARLIGFIVEVNNM